MRNDRRRAASRAPGSDWRRPHGGAAAIRPPGRGAPVGAIPMALLGPLLVPALALAHGGVEASGDELWTTWEFTPDIVIGTLIAAWLYLAGMWRLRHRADWMRRLRHLSYLGGVATVFLALQSPVDTLGDHNFLDHEIQHFLLRMLAPMLVMLSAPQAVLVAGTPELVTRALVAPVVGSGFVRGLFGALAHPAVVTGLFIGTLYVWQVPSLHSAALLDDGVHYLMHATMLASGLLFFWRIFDSRPAPKGLRFGVRMLMIVLVIPTQIVLGAYLTLKQTVVYPTYDLLGRVGAENAVFDETLGGLVVWIPSSMMMVVAIIVIVRSWGRSEALGEQRRGDAALRTGAATGVPLTAAALRNEVSGQNRAIAIGFAIIVLVFFSATIAIGVISEMSGL